MARPTDDPEQRQIDQEVRLSRTRETMHLSHEARERRRDRRSARAENAWFRDQLILMLKGAETEEELAGLGLSDGLIQEANLGDSLVQAWSRFRPDPMGALSKARGDLAGRDPTDEG